MKQWWEDLWDMVGPFLSMFILLAVLFGGFKLIDWLAS